MEIPGVGFAVVPRTDCPHLASYLPVAQELTTESGATAKLNAPCAECGDTSENWLCLHPACLQVLCSRYVNEHMLTHYEVTLADDTNNPDGVPSGHCAGVSFSDLSVWCYQCDSYVKNPAVLPLLRALHVAKHGFAPKGGSTLDGDADADPAEDPPAEAGGAASHGATPTPAASAPEASSAATTTTSDDVALEAAPTADSGPGGGLSGSGGGVGDDDVGSGGGAHGSGGSTGSGSGSGTSEVTWRKPSDDDGRAMSEAPDADATHLFVYGTLRPEAEAPWTRPFTKGMVARPAILPNARLYMSTYPHVVLGAPKARGAGFGGCTTASTPAATVIAADDKVVGTLMTCTSAAAFTAKLADADAIESYPGLYKRAVRRCLDQETGDEFLAFVYFNPDYDIDTPVPDGDFLAFKKAGGN